jgi:hypothetical protein
MRQQTFEGCRPNLQWHAYKDENILETMDRYVPIKDPIFEWTDDQMMHPSLFPRVRQRSNAWYQLRAPKDGGGPVIGSSSISKILGFECEQALSHFSKRSNIPWASNQSYVDFIKGTKTTFPKHVETMMKWGNIHEKNGSIAVMSYDDTLVYEEAGSYYEEINGMRFLTSPDGFFRRQDPEHPSLYQNGCVEIKCPSPFLVKDEKKSDDFYRYRSVTPHSFIPEKYYPQVQWQLMLTKNQNSLYCSWTPTKGYAILELQRNDIFIGEALKVMKWGIDKYTGIEDIPKNPFETYPGYKDFLELTYDLTHKQPTCLQPYKKIINTMPQQGNVFYPEPIITSVSTMN